MVSLEVELLGQEQWPWDPCSRQRGPPWGLDNPPPVPSTTQLKMEEAASSRLASMPHPPHPGHPKRQARTQNESWRTAKAGGGPRLQVSDAAE